MSGFVQSFWIHGCFSSFREARKVVGMLGIVETLFLPGDAE